MSLAVLLALALPAGAAGAADALAEARRRYRAEFVSPSAHARLAKALYDAGRPIDGFLVLSEGERLFGKERFVPAQLAVVLNGGLNPCGGAGEIAASSERYLDLKKKAQRVSEADLFCELAQTAALLDLTEEIEPWVDLALERAPAHRGALGKKAQLRYLDGDLSGALNAFGRLCDLTLDGPDAPGGIALMSNLAGGGGSRDLAGRSLLTLERLAFAHARHPRAYAALGMARWKSGDRVSAERMAATTRPGAQSLRAALALDEKRWTDAAAALQKALVEDPADAGSWENLALLHRSALADADAELGDLLRLALVAPLRSAAGVPVMERVSQTLLARRDGLRSLSPERLDSYLSSPDGHFRAEALIGLAKLRDPARLDAFVALLDDDVGAVTQNADYALFELSKSHRAAVRARARSLLESPKTFVRAKALNLFGGLEPALARSYTLKGLRDPQPFVRMRAQQAALHYFSRDAALAHAARAAYKRESPDMKTLLQRLMSARGR